MCSLSFLASGRVWAVEIPGGTGKGEKKLRSECSWLLPIGLPLAGCYYSFTKNKGHSAFQGDPLYTTFSFFWYVPPPIILLGVGMVTAPGYCTIIYPSLFSYTLLTLLWIVLLLNFPLIMLIWVYHLSPAGTLTETDEVSIFKDLEYNKVSLT